MKHTVILSCPMIKKELLSMMEEENISLPVYFLPAELHNDMDKMRSFLQDIIDHLAFVDRVVITASRCGNATVGLRATTAELLLPRGADCIDLLLSEKDLASRVRPERAIFLTDSWVESTSQSEYSYEALAARYGEDAAAELLKTMYRDYRRYIFLDSGVYDVAALERSMESKAAMLNMTTERRKAPCAALRKLVKGEIDEDFLLVPKGGVVAEKDFLLF